MQYDAFRGVYEQVLHGTVDILTSLAFANTIFLFLLQHIFYRFATIVPGFDSGAGEQICFYELCAVCVFLDLSVFI